MNWISDLTYWSYCKFWLSIIFAIVQPKYHDNTSFCFYQLTNPVGVSLVLVKHQTTDP